MNWVDGSCGMTAEVRHEQRSAYCHSAHDPIFVEAAAPVGTAKGSTVVVEKLSVPTLHRCPARVEDRMVIDHSLQNPVRMDTIIGIEGDKHSLFRSQPL
jgi:hypothetical protein